MKSEFCEEDLVIKRVKFGSRCGYRVYDTMNLSFREDCTRDRGGRPKYYHRYRTSKEY